MPDGTSKKRRLRNWLIYPAFQLPLIFLPLSVIAAAFVIFWVTGGDLIRELQPAAALSGIEVEAYRKILLFQSAQFHRAFLMATVIAMSLSTIIMLYFSHRMAGPMVALRNYFQAIRNGEDPIPTLHFRDNDFLSDIPPLINDAISSLVERTSAQKRDRA